MSLFDKLQPIADRLAAFGDGPTPFDTVIDEVCGPAEVMQHGARNGVWTDLMKPIVAKLTDDDVISLAAYTASLVP